MTNSPQCKKCIGNVICEPICEPNSGRCISFVTLVEEKFKSPNKTHTAICPKCHGDGGMSIDGGCSNCHGTGEVKQQ